MCDLAAGDASGEATGGGEQGEAGKRDAGNLCIREAATPATPQQERPINRRAKETKMRNGLECRHLKHAAVPDSVRAHVRIYRFCIRGYILRMRLTDDDRRFFSEVVGAAFSNPFSDERAALDRRILGGAEGVPQEALLAAVATRVSERLRELGKQRRGGAWPWSGEDGRLVRYALLFDVFHRHLDGWDALIRDQERAGPEPVGARVAARTIEELRAEGFGGAESARCAAIFYQLRRAYYFIERALVGRSAPMKRLRMRLWQNVFTHDMALYERHLAGRLEDFSTLLLGETGTGKGAAAEAIGRCGLIPFDSGKGRFAASFAENPIALNLSQFSESLIESELFGHRRGAFTGAIADHEGAFARCRDFGSIFLDEIGDVAAHIQVKLLRVLQDRTFTPVGGASALRFRGRVIAATNRPIGELRADGKFREDFYFRLTSDVIPVPALRERLADDPGEMEDLVGVIVSRILGGPDAGLVGVILGRLRHGPGQDYAWPGNFRELEQAVRRILLAGDYVAGAAPGAGSRADRLSAGIASGSLTADALMAEYCALLHERLGSYQDAARVAGLDWRTLKAHAARASGAAPGMIA